MIDQEKIKEGVRLLLEGIGEDPSREGLIETPDRIARMYTELFSGMEETPSTHLSKMFHTDNTEMVLEKDITFYSLRPRRKGCWLKQAGPDGRGLRKEAPAPGTAH